jgi:hypothetical protein
MQFNQKLILLQLVILKDAVNFIEDLGKGDYAGAAIDAALKSNTLGSW